VTYLPQQPGVPVPGIDKTNRDHELVGFAQALVRLRSVLGDERNVAERVSQEMRRLIFDHVEIDKAGSVVAVIRGVGDGPTLLFDAHMDTVDVVHESAWSYDPFGAEMVDGRIYGRGSSDMKGALAAMVYAVASLERASLGGNIVVSASVGEESVEGAALRAVMERHPADFVVIGEASGLDLIRAGRGRAEFVVETHGQPSHASRPEQGVNAVHLMAAAVAEIEKLPMRSHPFVGAGVMCLTDIISVPYPAHSVVPSGCRVTYERRLIPGEERQAIEGELAAACKRAAGAGATVRLATTDYRTYTGVTWEEPKWYPPWELSEEHELVQKALEGLRGAGFDPGFGSYQFCTNAAHSAGVAGVPTIGFGPSTEAHAHVIDEHVEIEQLLRARAGYAAISSRLLARR
jgi:putative selenium metabolism hydrolase